ncbi:hypothetical protein FQA39_LY19161 [Lamprigera yunnana]|nr:hypothetical protein FQA39_LY19161 [Lamprigera yunnana]
MSSAERPEGAAGLTTWTHAGARLRTAGMKSRSRAACTGLRKQGAVPVRAGGASPAKVVVAARDASPAERNGRALASEDSMTGSESRARFREKHPVRRDPDEGRPSQAPLIRAAPGRESERAFPLRVVRQDLRRDESKGNASYRIPYWSFCWRKLLCETDDPRRSEAGHRICPGHPRTSTTVASRRGRADQVDDPRKSRHAAA